MSWERLLRAWLLLLCWCCSGAALAAAPLVQVNVEGKQPVLVGQQVKINVKVMAPNFFTSAPPFPPLQIAGAIVTMPDERATLGTEELSGTTYAVVEKSYVFAAQQPGDFTLPPVRLAFTYGGDDGKPVQGGVTLPPTRISAKLPEGAAAAGAGVTMPVARVTIRQSFDRETTGLKTGDALVRTVETYAAQTQAMMIPPPQFEAPRGVRVFVADPVLDDETKDRAGFLGGRRTDRVTYVFERSGTYTLPAVEVRWFDAQANRSATAQAPAVTVHVAASLLGSEGIAPEAPLVGAGPSPQRPFDWARAAWWAALALALGALAWLVATRGSAWRAWLRARKAAHAASDGVMFAQVLRACSRGDAVATHQAWIAWSARHAHCVPGEWVARHGDEALAVQFELLGRGLYGAASTGGPTWGPDALADALRRAHKQWLHGTHPAARQHPWSGRPLGPLNPF
jgi:hypothetical protein